MILFINAVSSDWIIILFDEFKKQISSEKFSILWQESMKFIDIIDDFIKKNNVWYNSINNIIFVNWPGSFTWVRIITLVVNTLSFTFSNIKITPISYFDLFNCYPIVKSSSKRDLFVKKSKKDTIEVIQNEDFLEYIKINKINYLYWEKILELNVDTNIDYLQIIKNLKLEQNNRIDPLYVKKPSIS